jgi:predicted nucleic acid-binding Zn ribbon protein
MFEHNQICDKCQICQEYYNKDKRNSELLYFILIYLLLFYDNCPARFSMRKFPGGRYYTCSCGHKRKHDSKLLFFILIYIILFYS